MIQKDNWIQSKMECLGQMTEDQIDELEYCDDNDFSRNGQPTRTAIKETPFLKNNLKREQENMTEREKKIAELKRQLLAPAAPKVKPQKKEEGPAMEDKYKRVMDWGTPRLVSKNKLTLNQAQMESRSVLVGIANVRRGNVEPAKAKKPTGGFNQVSLVNFQKRLQQEEKKSEENVMAHKDLTKKDEDPNAIDYGILRVDNEVRSSTITPGTRDHMKLQEALA